MMMKKIRWFVTYINIWRIIPAYVFFKTNKFQSKCMQDLSVWADRVAETRYKNCFWQLGYFLVNEKHTRNIFLNRLHRNPVMWAVTRILFIPLSSLYISMPPEKLGGGFSVQHGFSTIINAKEIGERCRIFQQVTVGYNGVENPTIGNDVQITAGAIVIGKVHIGDGAVVGAGAVVTHDVASGDIVAGVPAISIRKR